MAIGHGDAAAARLRAGEALTLHRQFENGWGIAVALFMLAHAAADDEDYETARQLWEEGERAVPRDRRLLPSAHDEPDARLGLRRTRGVGPGP